MLFQNYRVLVSWSYICVREGLHLWGYTEEKNKWMGGEGQNSIIKPHKHAHFRKLLAGFMEVRRWTLTTYFAYFTPLSVVCKTECFTINAFENKHCKKSFHRVKVQGQHFPSQVVGWKYRLPFDPFWHLKVDETTHAHTEMINTAARSSQNERINLGCDCRGNVWVVLSKCAVNSGPVLFSGLISGLRLLSVYPDVWLISRGFTLLLHRQ